MGLCFRHYSPGKNSNLNAPVLLRQGAAPPSHYRTERDENALQEKMFCITLLTFPVLVVYKQLWSFLLWVLCTSEARTDGGTSRLNEGFLTRRHCDSLTQSQTRTYFICEERKTCRQRWHLYIYVYIFPHTQCVEKKKITNPPNLFWPPVCAFNSSFPVQQAH